ncbi:hypothetical protein U9M48_029240 [Paspalum notatum var. saurae]|uniref:Uncharacterized protein n=1 Tax=Paspalum notatum var. saurae TaxID=547442 RepID=A0AAQ3WPM8_PASNO
MAARCASSTNDELRSFRACLYVDQSSSLYLAAAGSWADFLLAVAAPAAGRLLAAADDGRALLRRAGGLCRLLYFGSLCRRVIICSPGGLPPPAPSRSKPWYP